jgi:putative membrane protein
VNLKWFLIIPGFLFFISGFFVAILGIDPSLAFVSALFVLILALPSFWVCYQWLGRFKGLVVLGVLCVHAIILESIAVLTGVPYGSFSYSSIIGWKILGITPWTVPFAYIPLVLGAVPFSSRFVNKYWQLVVSNAFLLVVIDMVLDPGAVLLGMWHYDAGGIYYGVPWSNFFGWLISGILCSTIFVYFSKEKAGEQINFHFPMNLAISTLYILSFWFSVAIWSGMVFPALIGGLLILSYVMLIRKNNWQLN